MMCQATSGARACSAYFPGGTEAQLAAGGCFDDYDGYARYCRAVAPLYAALAAATFIRFAVWAPAPHPHVVPTSASPP